MKKFFYVIWAIIALWFGSLIVILNKELLVIAVLLGPFGIAAILVIVGIFILSVYKLWKNRGIWTKNAEIEINK